MRSSTYELLRLERSAHAVASATSRPSRKTSTSHHPPLIPAHDPSPNMNSDELSSKVHGDASGAVEFALDAVIFGGSASGLWTLDRLRRAGRRAVLIEADRLGNGQTIASQGIIHGGLKYCLDGRPSASATAIRSMPAVWRECLEGVREPKLGGAVLRAPYCHLWHGGDLRGRFGLLGARAGLRVKPVPLARADWPIGLGAVGGEVCRLDEQVVEPRALVSALARPLDHGLLRVPPQALSIERPAQGPVRIALDPHRAGVPDARPLVLEPKVVVLAAGIGNAALRERFGLGAELMQIRSVQMLLARGDLPELNGHCIEGTAVALTITSDRDRAGRRVWQIGGGLSEDGVTMAPDAFVHRGRRLVEQALGGRSLPGTEWSAYRADKAEVTTSGGRRPDDAFALIENGIITAWPTKLALVPRLAEQVLALAEPLLGSTRRAVADFDRRRFGWPAPEPASPPWEGAIPWTAVD
jgi:glycine/D-amino acid oxidase-like deaminating enzyme